MEKLKELLKNTNKKLFLDVCSGAGNYIKLINSIYYKFEKIIGIDTLDRAIESANKNNKDERIEYIKMYASNIVFENNTFDVVTLSNSLHHLENISQVFNEMKRVLKDDGFIIISEMVSDNLDNKQLSHLKLHHFAAKIDRLLGEIHYDTYKKDEIIKIVEDISNLKIDMIWELEMRRREENTLEDLDYVKDVLTRLVNRIPDSIDKNTFLQEANEINQYIEENGYDSATTIVMILKK